MKKNRQGQSPLNPVKVLFVQHCVLSCNDWTGHTTVTDSSNQIAVSVKPFFCCPIKQIITLFKVFALHPV